MLKKIITTIMLWEAKFAILRHKPKIIGITGSVGKSSTKELISCLLSRNFKVRESPKSYNSQLGLTLSILGLFSQWSSVLGWLSNMIRGFWEIWNKNFPEVLVLEMGIDRPKDMERLLDIARPSIAVITAIGDIPVHVEFFSGVEELAQEKSRILKYLPQNGYAILNFDDEAVWDMKEKTKARVYSFGFGEHADFKASNLKTTFYGSVFKMDYDGASVPMHLKGVLGKQNVYPAIAAVVVGKIMGLNLIEISEYLSQCEFPPGRMKLLDGIKNSKIIDDSYNSSPMAAHAALDVLKELDMGVSAEVLLGIRSHFGEGGVKVGRKIAVLGDMLEIGKYTIEAHKAIGQKAMKSADILITIGPRSKFASDEALALGMEKSQIYHFSTSKEVVLVLKDLIKEGDLILVKGSQAMRMERIVGEIMAHPEDVAKLLVRQDEYWQNKE